MPWPLLIEALSYVTNFDYAVDLGCGTLNDTQALLDAGFKRVDAVDSNESIRELVANFPEYGTRLNFYASSFEDYVFPKEACDLVNAQFALPFAPPATFTHLWTRIADSLVTKGVFAGNFFGTNDDWAKDDRHSNRTFLSREQVETLFSRDNWEVIKFEEKEYDQDTAAGFPKHWHVFNVIASRVRS